MRGNSVDGGSINSEGQHSTATIFDNIKKNNQLKSLNKIQVEPVGGKSKRDLSVKAS
jgi:hypothetical protein